MPGRKIQYVEPGDDGEHCLVTITEEEAIKIQRKFCEQVNYHYEKDEYALDDFMIVYWARFVEEETNAGTETAKP